MSRARVIGGLAALAVVAAFHAQPARLVTRAARSTQSSRPLERLNADGNVDDVGAALRRLATLAGNNGSDGGAGDGVRGGGGGGGGDDDGMRGDSGDGEEEETDDGRIFVDAAERKPGRTRPIVTSLMIGSTLALGMNAMQPALAGGGGGGSGDDDELYLRESWELKAEKKKMKDEKKTAKLAAKKSKKDGKTAKKEAKKADKGKKKTGKKTKSA